MHRYTGARTRRARRHRYAHVQTHMWLSRKSINNNSFGVLRSLQQKACRRGDVKLAIQSSLEILDSGYPHPSLHYLKTICVEDKLPQGQYLVGDILREEKGIRRVSKKGFRIFFSALLRFSGFPKTPQNWVQDFRTLYFHADFQSSGLPDIPKNRISNFFLGRSPILWFPVHP